jgi:hypothetical protein
MVTIYPLNNSKGVLYAFVINFYHNLSTYKGILDVVATSFYYLFITLFLIHSRFVIYYANYFIELKDELDKSF